MGRFLLVSTYLLFPFAAACQAWADDTIKADTLFSQGQYDAALIHYKAALAAFPEDSTHTISYIRLIKKTGWVYYRGKSQYRQALPYYEAANEKTAAAVGYFSDEQAMGYFTVGQLYYYLQDPIKAVDYYNKAMLIWEQLHSKTSKEVAAVHNALGVLQNDKGNFEQAITHHLVARETREKLFGKKHGAYAQSCNNLAAIYWNLGQLDKAEPLAIEAKELRATIPGIEKKDLAISCVNLANIYRDMGKLEEAESLYLQAKNIREEAFSRKHQVYTETCNILAGLYLYMNRLQDAKDLLVEAMELRSAMGLAGEYADAQLSSNLAQVYYREKKHDSAMQLVLAALQIFEKMGAPALGEKAITAHLAGNISLHQKDYNKAYHYLTLAADIWAKRIGELHPDYISNILSFARLYRLQRNPGTAAVYYEKAFRAQQKQMENFFSFTTEREKNNFIKTVLSSRDEYLSFYYKDMPSGNKGLPFVVSLSSRNAILFSVQKLKNLVFNSRDTFLISQYQEWVQLKRQLLLLYQQATESKSSYVEDVKARADLLEKNIYRQLPSADSENNQQLLSNWSIIKTKLKKAEALVEFVEFNYFNGLQNTDSVYYAAMVIIDSLKEPQWVNLGTKAEVAALVIPEGTAGAAGAGNHYRGVVKLNSSKHKDEKLYNLLWAKLEPLLKNTSHVFYSPVGLLNRISFASLRKDSVTFLSDIVKLQQLSSAQQLMQDPRPLLDEAGEAVLFGGIDYANVQPASSSFFPYLPGTKKEVNNIAEVLGKSNYRYKIISGKAATEPALKSFSGLKAPQVLHIATHGFYADNTSVKNGAAVSLPPYISNSTDPLMRTGLMMAGADKSDSAAGADDGILTSYEVANLQLQHTKLVVLSACETALGDIQGTEGVYGLQRAFKMAGVENIIMSLWPVGDEVTAVFMETFYQHLVNKKTIEEAFSLTQTALKKQSRDGQNDWAAWILYK